MRITGGERKSDELLLRGFLIANLGEFKVKTVGSPPTLAQRVLNETLWNPAFFCCWKIEAAQGRNGRVPAAKMIAAKCRRLGGSLAAGFQPAKKDSRFSTSCSASLLNAAYWHLHRAVSVCLGLLPLLFKERAGVRFARLSVILNHSSSQPSPLRGEGANPPRMN